jgi:hypothetical protein
MSKPLKTYTSRQVRHALAIRDHEWKAGVRKAIVDIGGGLQSLRTLWLAGPDYPKLFPMDLAEFFAAPSVPAKTPAAVKRKKA